MIKSARVFKAAVPGSKATVYDTPLDRYLDEHSVRPLHLAREARMARQALRLYRAGVQEPTRPVMARIVLALRTITGRDVKVTDLWYLGEARQDDLPETERSIAAAPPVYKN